MSKELYVVNTTINHSFLFGLRSAPFFGDEIKAQRDFINKVRLQYPNFNVPYLALSKDGRLHIPDNIDWPGGVCGGVRDGIVGGGGENREDCSLDEFIDRFVIGHRTMRIDKDTPITGVVEFSPTELYPEVIKKLEKKYEIKRILVD
ncbi:hypothetical protein JW756_03400 [Candidatus Woesearchaeota archaeon]|nr:hypothetical protein [Candidatus Woesearchaeota archaeon]